MPLLVSGLVIPGDKRKSDNRKDHGSATMMSSVELFVGAGGLGIGVVVQM